MTEGTERTTAQITMIWKRDLSNFKRENLTIEYKPKESDGLRVAKIASVRTQPSDVTAMVHGERGECRAFADMQDAKDWCEREAMKIIMDAVGATDVTITEKD